MATEKRLIEIIECLRNCANNTDCERCSRWLHPCDEKCVDDLMASAADELEKFVNVAEVVRCKDCKFWECGTCKLHSEEPDQYSVGLSVVMMGTDFCSYGERKDNGTA